MQENIPHIAYKDWLINQQQPERKDTKKYIDFWLKHIDYCKSGIYTGGIFFSGWLYWHLNFFKVTLDKVDEWDNEIVEIGHPRFRDNEYYIDYGLNKAYSKEWRKPLMIFGSRRFAKSVFLASRIAFKSFIFQNSHSVVIGASYADINNITKYFQEFYSTRPDCFYDLRLVGNFQKTSADVEIVYNKKVAKKEYEDSVKEGNPVPLNPLTEKLFSSINLNENRLLFSRLSVRNLEHGQVRSKDEMLAGITPTEVIFDEVGKYKFDKQWLALKPALATSRGTYRTIPLFCGTGGDVDMSEDAEQYFLEAEKMGFTPISDDEYRNLVKDKHFNHYPKNKKTGLFVPGQMAMVEGSQIEKLKIPAIEYFDKKFSDKEREELEGLEIEVTDWESIVNYLTEHRKSLSDEKRIKNIMYYPQEPEDCFLLKSNNPFPVEEAKRTRTKLEENGLLGENVTLSKGVDGRLYINDTDKTPIMEFPYRGGSYDAPCVIIERPYKDDPKEIPVGSYVAGFDGYKTQESITTDSVGSFYIFKRVKTINGYHRQIVAHLATRPKDDKTFYRQVLYLLEWYNAELLPEYDTNLYNYLNAAKSLHYLADCQSVAERITPNTRAQTTAGLPATNPNKNHYISLVKSYCWSEVVIGYDEAGEEIKCLGVETIHDPMLLKELEDYRVGGNFDRIAAFGHALVWDEHLSIKGMDVEERSDGYVRDKEKLSFLQQLKTAQKRPKKVQVHRRRRW